MFNRLRRYTDIILRKAKLKPLSLAEKFRVQFGLAVIFSLLLGLLIPYFWMSKLTEKIALDSGRAVAETVFERHFDISADTPRGLPRLTEGGGSREPNDLAVRWIRFSSNETYDPNLLKPRENKVITAIRGDKHRDDYAWIDRSGPAAMNHYIRLVQAEDSCITCHNPQGSAFPFNKNQLVGLIITNTRAREIARTLFVNRVVTIVAGLLAATGAMVAFYLIVQRIILRPIRQLRALVNNISEGNLEARSAIRTGDEYERLSNAFNEMLDGLQESQEKLRQANRQLDAKIAQLSDRNIELFRANKLKSEFLANISHEFRTPLNAILGFADLLKEKPDKDPEKSRRYAQNIITSGRNLLNMINDLLDLAKAEAGRMTVRVEKVEIGKLCQNMISFFLPLSEKKHLLIEPEIADDIPPLNSDSAKIQQVLYNLLSNAIKFTPEKGKIFVTAEMLDEKTVRIAVTDSGPGISRENLPHIFEKFRQIDGSITRGSAGSGLGLAICKELAALLAGEISVESEEGKGAVFRLDIPINLTLDNQPVDHLDEP